MDLEKFIARIVDEEGFTPKSFWDDAPGGGGGQFSWGYGTVAPGPDAFITIEQAQGDLREKAQGCVLVFDRIFKGCTISDERQLALMDMIYNLGESRFRKFKKLIQAVKVEDWEWAAEEIRASVYHKQVHARAEENADIMEGKT